MFKVQTGRRFDDGALHDAAWRIYAEAFAKAAERAVQDQMCYTPDTLKAALVDPDYVKFLVYRGDELVGFGLATDDMEKASVTYVNPGFLARTFPAEYAAKRLWYFTAIAVLPELQGSGAFFAAMGAEMTSFIDGVDGVVLFDHSMETSAPLPQTLVRVIKAAQQRLGLRTNDAEYSELGGQRYGVIRFLKKP